MYEISWLNIFLSGLSDCIWSVCKVDLVILWFSQSFQEYTLELLKHQSKFRLDISQWVALGYILKCLELTLQHLESFPKILSQVRGFWIPIPACTLSWNLNGEEVKQNRNYCITGVFKFLLSHLQRMIDIYAVFDWGNLHYYSASFNYLPNNALYTLR